jgi:hypothetical protein
MRRRKAGLGRKAQDLRPRRGRSARIEFCQPEIPISLEGFVGCGEGPRNDDASSRADMIIRRLLG